MSCILRIEGQSFNLDAFIKESGLQPYNIWRIGEPDRDNNVYSKNGLALSVSNAEFNNFEAQKIDAISFLQSNFYNLVRLQNYDLLRTEEPILDFAIYTRMNNVAAQFDKFEPQLTQLAGDLNIIIELSQYHFDE
jgi:hypothetical protein